MNERQKRLQNVGEQECPRRAESPAFSFPLPDYWKLGTWAATEEEANAEVAEFMAEHPTGGIGNTLWLYPGNQPRTCSYCGGGHPDDLIALVKVGWEVDPTDKSYKRYLEPPGYRAYVTRLLGSFRTAHPGMGDSREKVEPPEYPSPVPPVKLYVQHFSPDQIEVFNAVLNGGN